MDDEALIDALYWRLFSRPPIDAELEHAAAFLSEFTAAVAGDSGHVADAEARRHSCQTLLMSNELFYVN